jgi:hypothetical protein
MSSFNEANRVKNSLKMALSNYSWYNGISVEVDRGSYIVVVNVAKTYFSSISLIPPFKDGIDIQVWPN